MKRSELIHKLNETKTMKLVPIFSFALLILVACKSNKKSSTATVATKEPATKAPSTTTVVASGPALPASMGKKSQGIYAPGNEELIAIQAQFSDVTMQTLNEGYDIYTGVCTNCHGAKSIYSRSLERWPAIIDDMALKSRLSNTAKDAVYKYVLAIKARQPKNSN